MSGVHRLLLLSCALAISCRPPSAAPPPVPSSTEFQDSRRVLIEGYDGDDMEPFVSRDGRYLFFNNRNEGADNTNLYWAERIDRLHFRYPARFAA